LDDLRNGTKRLLARARGDRQSGSLPAATVAALSAE
jgi:hypothetical protein